MGRVFCVWHAQNTKNANVSVASVPLPPSSPIHWGCQTHPRVSFPLPSPPLPAKHEKQAHVACFSCLALLHLSPPAEHEKRTQCGTFFVFSTRAAPLTPSASPLAPNTEITQMGVFSVFGTPLASCLALNTENTPTWVCSLCSVRSISLPSCQTRTALPCECAFCVWRALCLPPHIEHGEHTHVGVFSVFSAPCTPSFTPDTENTPMWVCSLVFSPYPHLPLPLITTLLGKFLFR